MQYIVFFILYITAINVHADGQIFNEALSIINSNYAEDLEHQNLEKAAIKGIISSLDSYSTYIDKHDVEKLNDIINNKYVGIGIEITTARKCPMILDIIENSPAAEAGLSPGDIILKSDGKNLCDLNIKDVRSALHGKINSSILLEIIRNDKKIVQKISRKKIKTVPYSIQILENIAYVKIKHFTSDLAKNIKDEYEKKKNDQLKGVILDLRFNPGGLFDEAVNVSSLFLRKNTKVVSLNFKNTTEDFYSSDIDITHGLPIVIIINALSASASEIVAGALQDNKRAQIIGEKSFGKGSVQKTFNLQSGDILKLTIGLYCTPSGKIIQDNGVEPDIYAADNIMISDIQSIDQLYKKAPIDNIPKTAQLLYLRDMTSQHDYQLMRAMDIINTMHFINAKYHHQIS